MSKNYYTTMDSVAEIYSTFSNLLLENKLSVETKPMAWCTNLKCVIADIDIEYRQKTSICVDVELCIRNQDRSVIIWTTTPWTLLDNTAVAYNKNIKYSEIMCDGKIFVISSKLIASFSERKGKIQSRKEINNHELNGLFVTHPIKNHYVPLVHSDHVTDTEGTGFVHIAPAHGLEDFDLAKKEKLDVVDSVDESGKYIDQEFSIKDEEKLLSLIGNKLLAKSTIEHSYPFCTRSNNHIIYRITEQVFLNISHLNMNDCHANWYPSSLEKSFFSTVTKREEWCVSRNRTYGVPLSLFIHKKNKNILINKQIQDKIIEKMKIDPYYFLEESCIDILDGIVEDKKDWTPYIGVLDVWFDSSCVSSIVSKFYNSTGFRTADLYLEGKDQIRGWFQSSFLTCMLSENKMPYKNVVTHGFCMAESPKSKKGEKMSKSLGNVVDLSQQILKGNDLMRIWVAKSNTRDDVTIGQVVQQESANQYRKFRNVIRYMISIVESYPCDKTKGFEILELAVLSKLKSTFSRYMKHMESYEFNLAFSEIKIYFDYLSNQYFNWRKRDLYSECEKGSIIYSFCFLLKGTLIMLHPFIPFTTEEAFLYIKNMKNLSIFDSKISIQQENVDFFNNINIDPVENQIDQLNVELKKIRVIFDEMLQNSKAKHTNQIEVTVRLENLYDFNASEITQKMLDCRCVYLSDKDSCSVI